MRINKFGMIGGVAVLSAADFAAVGALAARGPVIIVDAESYRKMTPAEKAAFREELGQMILASPPPPSSSPAANPVDLTKEFTRLLQAPAAFMSQPPPLPEGPVFRRQDYTRLPGDAARRWQGMDRRKDPSLHYRARRAQAYRP